MYHGYHGEQNFWGGIAQLSIAPVPSGSIQVQAVDVHTLWRGRSHLVFGHLCDLIEHDDAVQCPALVRSGHLLSHGRNEALRVEEASHPKDVRAAIKYPCPEL